MAKHLEEHGQASTSDIENLLWRELPKLYKFNGRKYQGTDPNRIVRGIKSLPIFSVRDEVWSLKVRPRQIEEFVQYKAQKLALMQKCKVKKTARDDLSLPDYPQLASNKYVRYANMLEGFTKIMMRDPKYAHVFKNPLRHVTGNETFAEALLEINESRLIGLVKGFEISSQYCKA